MDEAIVNETTAIPALHESLEDIRAWLAGWHTTGLLLDGRLVGMVRTRRDGDDWHVGRLAVAPDLRGRGLGRRLLHIAEAAAEPGCRRILLTTGARSERNLALYRSEGYRELVGTDATVIDLAKEL